VTGQAIPSVSPQIASLYFKKAECFCFINQLLESRETKEMVVRFEVDKDLPEDVTALTLSYTFFRVNKVAAKLELIKDRN
jgi:cytochrome c oxidase assembly protein subunit 11